MNDKFIVILKVINPKMNWLEAFLSVLFQDSIELF